MPDKSEQAVADLYVIATPIGNIEDITVRALNRLAAVDVLLCEDTRKTGQLLARYKISTKLQRFDAHTEPRLVPTIIANMQAGVSYGLVSDAGMPLISDAGFLLVRAVHTSGLCVSCLPGASALLCALVVAGVPCVPFYFAGFLPHKKGRQTAIEALVRQPNTWILYESPHRLLRTLKALSDLLGAQTPITLARELTKWHEEVSPSPIQALIDRFEAQPPKGECVLVYNPNTPAPLRDK